MMRTRCLLGVPFVAMAFVAMACNGAAGDGDGDGDGDDDDDTTIDLECEDANQLRPTDFGKFGVQMFPTVTVEAGVERCDSSTFNVTSVEECLIETTIEDCTLPIAEGGGCGTDAPCARGRCVIDASQECRCLDFCESDADCGAGNACVCSAAVRIDDTSYEAMIPVPTCVPAECRTGADCLSGACGVAINGCGTPRALRCRSVADPCASDADCAEADEGRQCIADNGSGWQCGDNGTCE